MKKGAPTVTATTASKGPLPPAQGKLFDPTKFVRPGVSAEEIVDIKSAFDLFDTDQGGSIDTNCKFELNQNSRLQWCHWDSTQRMPSFSK